jgi:hypothetical protein
VALIARPVIVVLTIHIVVITFDEVCTVPIHAEVVVFVVVVAVAVDVDGVLLDVTLVVLAKDA